MPHPTANIRRTRAVLQGAGAGLAARFLSVACTLLQVPVALGHLGLEGFGVWMTLTSAAGLLTVADLGLGAGVRTLLAERHGRDRPHEVQALAGLVFRRLLVPALVVALAGTVLAWTLDWGRLLNVTSPEIQARLPWAVTALALTSALALPTSLGPALAAALQFTWVQHAGLAVGGLLTLAVVVAGAAWHLSWLAIVVAALALPALVNVGTWIALRRHLGWRGAAPDPSDEDAAELSRLSRWFLVPTVGSLFATMGLPVMVAAAAGPGAAAAFNLVQRVLGMVGQVHWLALAALWPAFSEARARQDWAWIRRAHLQSWTATLVAFLPLTLALAAALPWIVNFWVGGPVPELTRPLLAAGAFWFGLQLLGQPPAVLLNGLGRIRRVAVLGTVGHLFSLAAMLAAARWGAAGVVLGMASGYLLVGLPAALWESRRALAELPR